MILTRLALLTVAAGAVAGSDPARAQIISAKQDGTITTASLYALLAITASLVTIVVGVITILRSNKAARKEAQKEADERTDKITAKIEENRISIDDRVKTLEIRSERFLPGDVIEGKIQHLKDNRTQVELRQEEKLKELSLCVNKIEQQVVRLEARHESTERTLVEVKSIMKDMAADMKAGFKELSDRKAA